MSSLLSIGESYRGVGKSGIKKLINYYNEHCVKLVDTRRRYYMKEGDDWCAMFLSVLAHKAGLSPKAFPYEVSVYYQWTDALKKGMSTTSTELIKVGDLAVYDWGKGNRFNHVGIIKATTANHLDVLEGNYRGTVGVRRVSRLSKALRGYILLDVNMPPSDSKLWGLVDMTLRGKFGDGEERKERLGKDYNKVQAMINNM